MNRMGLRERWLDIRGTGADNPLEEVPGVNHILGAGTIVFAPLWRYVSGELLWKSNYPIGVLPLPLLAGWRGQGRCCA